MTSTNKKLFIGIAIGLASSVVAGIAIEYFKQSINKRRVLRGVEPLGAFEEGEWRYDPATKTSTWVPA